MRKSRASCPRLASPFSGHNPILPAELRMRRVQFVTMLRDPTARLISAFMHARAGGSGADMPSGWAVGIRKGSISFLDFVQMPRSTGCATSLIMGKHCYQTTPLTSALERVRQNFVFVGIVEFWRASICLFSWGNVDSVHLDLLASNVHENPANSAGSSGMSGAQSQVYAERWKADKHEPHLCFRLANAGPRQ